MNPNYTTVNVAAQERDPNSCLHYFRKLTKLRKENPVLVYGSYTLLDKDNPEVYTYTREWQGRKVLVLLNFTSRPAALPEGVSLAGAKLLLDNYTDAGNGLRPYEAAVYDLPAGAR